MWRLFLPDVCACTKVNDLANVACSCERLYHKLEDQPLASARGCSAKPLAAGLKPSSAPDLHLVCSSRS